MKNITIKHEAGGGYQSRCGDWLRFEDGRWTASRGRLDRDNTGIIFIISSIGDCFAFRVADGVKPSIDRTLTTVTRIEESLLTRLITWVADNINNFTSDDSAVRDKRVIIVKIRSGCVSQVMTTDTTLYGTEVFVLDHDTDVMFDDPVDVIMVAGEECRATKRLLGPAPAGVVYDLNKTIIHETA